MNSVISMQVGDWDRGLVRNVRDAAINAYLAAFYDRENGFGYFKAIENGDRLDSIHFWRFAEMIEVVEDAADRTGDTRYRGIVVELCDGFVKLYSNEWGHNKFNDDIMWACIAFLRASKLTGSDRYVDMAQRNLDIAWARAYDSALNGGLWWTTDNTSKNACVNGPASIAASLLYRAGCGNEYQEKAIAAFDWIVQELFDESTGRVFDNVRLDGTVERTVWSYNLGTFIGAATLLYETMGRSDYLDFAGRAMECAVNDLTGQYGDGILDDEYDDAGAGGDSTGFKEIFARWASHYIRKSGEKSYTSWLRRNAAAAWENKNRSSVIWARWGKASPELIPNSFECSSAVALLQSCP